jgi:hypothetical protein
MTEDPEKKSPNPAEQLPAFPPPNFPTVYADGILNVTFGPEVTRFYLFRQDPSLRGDNTTEAHPFLQVVMPATGFLGAAVFLEHFLKTAAEQNPGLKVNIDQMRQQVLESLPSAAT